MGDRSGPGASSWHSTASTPLNSRQESDLLSNLAPSSKAHRLEGRACWLQKTSEHCVLISIKCVDGGNMELLLLVNRGFPDVICICC